MKSNNDYGWNEARTHLLYIRIKEAWKLMVNMCAFEIFEFRERARSLFGE